MTRVYLEYCGDTWTKCWSAYIEGNELVTEFGKRGGRMRETRSAWPSRAAALEALSFEAQRKRRKGYVDSCGADGEAWDALRSLRSLCAEFASVPGPRASVQLLTPLGSASSRCRSRVGGGAPKGVEVPRSYALSYFLGPTANVDTRQAHLLTLALDELQVAGLPIGSALSLFTPAHEWLPKSNPVEVVIADMGSDLEAQEHELPPISPSYTRYRRPRTLRISPPVEVPTLAFSVRAHCYESYVASYAAESRRLQNAPRKMQRAILAAEGEYAEISYWTGQRRRLSQKHFEAIDRIQLLLLEASYVGGSPLRQRGELEPEFSKFHLQFGEDFGVKAQGGRVYVGLHESDWDCR